MEKQIQTETNMILWEARRSWTATDMSCMSEALADGTEISSSPCVEDRLEFQAPHTIFSFFHKSRFGWYQLFVLVCDCSLQTIWMRSLMELSYLWVELPSDPTLRIKSRSLSVETRWFVSRCCENMPRCVKGQSRWIEWCSWTICCCCFKRWEGKRKVHPGKLAWNPKCRFGRCFSFLIGWFLILGSSRSFSGVYGYGCG